MGRYTFYECDNLLLQMLDTDFIRRSLKDSKCLKHFSHYNVNCIFNPKKTTKVQCVDQVPVVKNFWNLHMGVRSIILSIVSLGLRCIILTSISLPQAMTLCVNRSHMKLLSCLESEFAPPEEFPHYVDLINMVVRCLEAVALMKQIHHKQTFKGTITFLMQNEVCQLR